MLQKYVFFLKLLFRVKFKKKSRIYQLFPHENREEYCTFSSHSEQLLQVLKMFEGKALKLFDKRENKRTLLTTGPTLWRRLSGE